MPWLPETFAAPQRAELPTGHHLRQIRADDVEIDYPAVMGSRERLWALYGELWGWPPATMTYEADRADLARHEAEMAVNESFNYAVLDAGETELLGCIYIDPPGAESPPGSDAFVAWWVVDGAVGTPLEAALAAFVPGWLAETWQFGAVHFHP
jgi:hypothetical protein